MDNHPIPQDVTGFQFKLIGNMTVKQFAFVASGVIMGWIFYSSPLFFLIKFPLALLSAGIGFCIAFLPIDGRPLDSMIGYFIKALITPNQYLFKKEEKEFLPVVHVQKIIAVSQNLQPTSGENLQAILESLAKTPKNKLDEKEMAFLQSVAPSPTTSPAPTAQPVSVAQPTLEKTEQPQLQQQLQPAAGEEPTPTQPTLSPEDSQEYKQLQEELEKNKLLKETLEKEILELKKVVANERQQNQATPKPEETAQVQTEKKDPETLKRIQARQGNKTITMETPEAPNLITGMVKDPRGNIIPGILVEIKDAEANPVRAFKTNAIGQFESATPLSDGVYTIEFDDPTGKNTFGAIEITLVGEVIAPIEMTSQDQREELRQALFTNQNQ